MQKFKMVVSVGGGIVTDRKRKEGAVVINIILFIAFQRSEVAKVAILSDCSCEYFPALSILSCSSKAFKIFGCFQLHRFLTLA